MTKTWLELTHDERVGIIRKLYDQYQKDFPETTKKEETKKETKPPATTNAKTTEQQAEEDESYDKPKVKKFVILHEVVNNLKLGQGPTHEVELLLEVLYDQETKIEKVNEFQQFA